MDSLGKGRMHVNFKVQDWGFKERLSPSGCGDGVYGAGDAGQCWSTGTTTLHICFGAKPLCHGTHVREWARKMRPGLFYQMQQNAIMRVSNSM